MLWENFKREFSNDKARPSYSSNVEINNRKIIRLYKQFKILYKCKRYSIDFINKIFFSLEYLLFPINRNNIYKYGLYLQENNFMQLTISSPEISKIHQDLGWNFSFTTVKAAYYYLFFISNGVNFNDKKIVEIGPGGGHLASIILYYHSSVLYRCVDLPEMKEYALFEMKRLDHMRKLLSFQDFNSNKFQYIYPQEFFTSLDTFDILLNIESFGEMPLTIANEYIQYGLPLLNRNGYFISVNRMNRVVNPKQPKETQSYNGYYQYRPLGLKVRIEEPDKFKLNDGKHQVDLDKMNVISVLIKD